MTAAEFTSVLESVRGWWRLAVAVASINRGQSTQRSEKPVEPNVTR